MIVIVYKIIYQFITIERLGLTKMADAKVLAPLCVLITGLILVRYLPQHQQEYFRYLNTSMRSDFNTTFAPKQPIQTGLAVLARANRLKVFEINSERSKKKNVIMKLLFSILLMSGDIQSNPGPCKIPMWYLCNTSEDQSTRDSM